MTAIFLRSRLSGSTSLSFLSRVTDWLAMVDAGVDKRRQHDLLERRHAGLQRVRDRGVEVQDPIQGGEDAGDECDRVVVGGLQRDPGEGPLVTVAPRRQQGRLAIAGRGRDQHHRSVGRRHQAVEQLRAVDVARSPRRPGQLAGDDAHLGREVGLAREHRDLALGQGRAEQRPELAPHDNAPHPPVTRGGGP
jgi:hypothetical protein